MRYVSGEEMLALHSEIIDATGGLHGIRDIGLIHSIIIKPQTTVGGKEVYKDIFITAAVYLESLVRYHAFIDGNKRTGFATSARFLFLNRYELDVPNKKVEHFVLRIAIDNIDLPTIRDWLKKHSKKYK